MIDEQIREDPAPKQRAAESSYDAGRDEPRRFSLSQLKQDRDQLRLLSIFYYILAALAALGGSAPVIHVSLGIAMISGAMPGTPQAMGFLFISIGSMLILFLWTMALCDFLAARWLARQQRYRACFGFAIFVCFSGMLGLILGIFTILVLKRESVKELFQHGERTFSTDEDYD